MHRPATTTSARIPLTPLVVVVAVVLMAALLLGVSRSLFPARPATPPPQAVTTAIATPDPVQTPATPADQIAPDLEPRPAAAAERTRRRQSLFAAFETRFREDTSDPDWSASAERKLIEAASEPSLAQFGVPLSYNARCSAHLCRVDLSFARRTEADDWSELYLNGMNGMVTSVRSTVVPGPGGTVALIIYATRAGSESLLFDPSGMMLDADQ